MSNTDKGRVTRRARRVLFAGASAAVGLATTVPPVDGPTPVTAASATPAPLIPPASGVLFGAYVSPTADGQSPDTVSALESSIGRKLDINRIYSNWDTSEPSSQAVWDISNGIIPLISIDALTTSGVVPWSQIASGADDAAIVAQAQGLASLNAPVLLSFSHEPAIDTANGTAADFVRAWRHYVTVVRHYAPNVSFVLILNLGSYGPASVAQWYPGDAYVDWVGVDGYNVFGCRGPGGPVWEDFGSIFANFYKFAVAHDKPAAIAEWASTEDPNTPGRKANWITAAGQTLESWPQIKAVSYFDSAGHDPRCAWTLDSSSSVMTAFSALGSQAWFNPRPEAVLSADPPVGRAPLTVTFNCTGTTKTMHRLASWQLDFGDGTSVSGSGHPPASPEHTYRAGDYTATLDVTDTADQTNETSVTVQTTPPSIGTDHAGVTSTTNATLYASANPNGLDTTLKFEWGTTPALGQSTTFDIGPGTHSVYESAGLTGLMAGTVYDYRVMATSAAGTSSDPMLTFRTQGNVPGIANVTATLRSPTSVVLSGDINPRQVGTRWHFEYGPTTSYGSSKPVPFGNAGAGADAVAVSVTLTGLAVSSTYHFALVASNAVGTTTSGDHAVRTPSPPKVGSEHASLPSSTSAKLSASIDPRGMPTTFRFRWGTTRGTGNATPSHSAGAGTTAALETARLTGLHPGTTYYWRATATNAAGTTVGPLKTFTAG